MILSMQCDGCGVVGPSEMMAQDEQVGDLCPKCAISHRLRDLIIEHSEFKERLEQTHLKRLKEMEGQIAALEEESRRLA